MADSEHPVSGDEPYLAAYIGPNWEKHYRDAFAAIDSGSAGRFGPWNWAAALMPFWLAWRRLILAQLLAVVFFWLALLFIMIKVDAFFLGGGYGAFALTAVLAWLVAALPAGIAFDRLLHWRAHRALRRERARNPDAEALRAAMANAGLPRLQGPLLVVGLGGTLVYAITAWFGAQNHGHDRMQRAMLRSTLRSVIDAQELHFTHFNRYAPALADSILLPGDSVKTPWVYQSSAIIEIGHADSSGWNATIRYPSSELTCSVFVGTAPPPPGAASEGQIVCHEH